jgi:hypothetical protein
MWLRIALTEAAQAAARTKGTYLAAHHAQIRGRRGTQKAIGATRHDILIAYYHIVRDRVSYRTWERTGTVGAARPNNKPAGWCVNSSASA